MSMNLFRRFAVQGIYKRISTTYLVRDLLWHFYEFERYRLVYLLEFMANLNINEMRWLFICTRDKWLTISLKYTIKKSKDIPSYICTYSYTIRFSRNHYYLYNGDGRYSHVSSIYEPRVYIIFTSSFKHVLHKIKKKKYNLKMLFFLLF